MVDLIIGLFEGLFALLPDGSRRVPKVVGKSLTDAGRTLRGRSFGIALETLGALEGSTEPPPESAIVVGQDPSAGERARKKSSVTVFVDLTR